MKAYATQKRESNMQRLTEVLSGADPAELRFIAQTIGK